MGLDDEKLTRRFWLKVADASSEDCWLWEGGTTTGFGYGVIKVAGKNRQAHRMSWELAHGPIPAGMEVCHNCPGGDNPRCVNPAHLWLGTHAQNMADMAAKGRAPGGRSPGLRNARHTHPETTARGEANGNSRLTSDQIREIRARRAGGETLRSIGVAFGVTRQAIRYVVSGETWRHVS